MNCSLDVFGCMRLEWCPQLGINVSSIAEMEKSNLSVAESKPFLKEESYFADAKFYSEGEDFYSAGLSTVGFEIKKDTNNDQRLIVVPPHQLMTSISKTTCGEPSKGKQPQTTLADVKGLRKELTFPIP
ncbi:Uncharacterized protein Adt_31121 [Abeliophyllum distichum]|uniref:Uncharacterized protein n=1 Tax=Abeliophyllum distichum TaxID=126358 RepID=A0ABD1RD74_9LAMI